MSNANPLLQVYDLPPFNTIRPEHAKPAVDHVLAANRQIIAQLNGLDMIHWDTLVLPLDELDANLSRAWGPVSHLNAVNSSPEWREAYESCLPVLSEYFTEMGQHRGLFEKYLWLSTHAATLDETQKYILEQDLRDFRLSGIDLNAEKQKIYGKIQAELTELASQFSNHVLDATQAWTMHISDANQLIGLPESAMAQLAKAAQKKDLEGWLITLEFPSYHAIITYADDRSLRKTIYEAYVTRASELGPHASQFDNGQVMQQILTLRFELAQLLGYADYANLSLATKMAQSPEEVYNFLMDLASRSRPFAQKDIDELKSFAANHGCNDLQSWDMPYFSEKLREDRYQISQEAVRAYFPIDRVLTGLFEIAQTLFAIGFNEIHQFERWHPDVRLFEVIENDQCIGRFYLDLYARANKRGGAWMDSTRDKRLTPQHQLESPIAYLVGNFAPATGNKPALLTHDEVTTLFHEFGHGLQHLLTRIKHAGASGINGIAWDAVELPSQFMENWCWAPEGLASISGHYETGEPLPKSLLNNLLAAKNFQAGLMMLRQVEFSLLDLNMHTGKPQAVQQTLEHIRSQISVMLPPSYNRFPNSFSHVFAGGYAAGYYSYKWAEVLSADAYECFEENGIMDSQTGSNFRETVLALGGSKPALEVFKAFRGRAPSIDALLRHSGFTEKPI